FRVYTLNTKCSGGGDSIRCISRPSRKKLSTGVHRLSTDDGTLHPPLRAMRRRRGTPEERRCRAIFHNGNAHPRVLRGRRSVHVRRVLVAVLLTLVAGTGSVHAADPAATPAPPREVLSQRP